MEKLKKMNWLIVSCVALIIVIGSVASCSSDKTTKDDYVITSENTEISETEPAFDTMVVTVDELVEDYNNNKIHAENTYKNKYVKLTGKLSIIDSNGKYFSLDPLSGDFTLTNSFTFYKIEGAIDNDGYDYITLNNVRCYTTEEHLDTVMDFTKGQEVTVIGIITSVEEGMGYTVKVESIQ